MREIQSCRTGAKPAMFAPAIAFSAKTEQRLVQSFAVKFLLKILPLAAVFFILASPIAWLVIPATLPVKEVWTRESPLVNATLVASVHEGYLTLADGRRLRPAGVTRHAAVSSQEFDLALRAICNQGVIVVRDLGDGRAMLVGEAKFYNWCGTTSHHGFRTVHWAGTYLQCPVSELLIHAGYADSAPDEPGLTPREKWRLEGVGEITAIEQTPSAISVDDSALSYDGSVTYLSGYDANLERYWKPGPK